MAHDVFVSYSSKDKPIADALCATLESRGVRCWIAPRDVLPGMDWGEAIVDAIAGSRVMVLIFSASANASPQVRREVERAVHRDVAIVPFRIEEGRPSKSLEYFISTPHWLDAIHGPMERHLDRLSETVKALLDRQSAGIGATVEADEDAAVTHGGQPSHFDRMTGNPETAAPSPIPTKVLGPRRRRIVVAAVAVLSALAVAVSALWLRARGPADDRQSNPSAGWNLVHSVPATAASRPAAWMLPLEAQVTTETESLAKATSDASVALASDRRATLYLRLGRVQEAEVDLRRAINAFPRVRSPWYRLACLLAYQGRRQEYADLCRALLQEARAANAYDEASNARTMQRTARACSLLLPNGVWLIEPKAAIAMVNTPENAAGASNPMKPEADAKALVFLRARDYVASIEWAEKALAVAGSSSENMASRAATAHLISAMAHHALGNTMAARAALARGVEQIDRDLFKLGEGDVHQRGGLESWLICQTLRHEAARVVNGS